MAPTLSQVFTIRLYRSVPDTIIPGSSRGSSMRIITPYSSGYLRSIPSRDTTDSSPINATLLSGSSNCLHLDMTASPAPTTYLDARVHFRDDATGAVYYMRFEGVARTDALIQKILDGSSEARTTESREHYEFSHPVFEVSREEDRWMESTAWVGHAHYVVEREGGRVDVAVEFDVYKLVTG